MRIRDQLGVFSVLGLILCALCLLPGASQAQPPTSVFPPGTLPPCSTDPTPPTSLVFRRGCILSDGSVYYGNSAGSAVATAGSGGVSLLTSGADGDSSTTSSDSGLELVGGLLTIIRGCSDGDILNWDETSDVWTCITNSVLQILSSGSDGDSMTTSSDSGLELIGGEVTLIRGCADGEAPIWNETTDVWTCGPVGSTEVDTLDTVFDRGKEIDGANSKANAFKVGDGTDWCLIYVGAGGPTIECEVAGSPIDQVINIATSRNFKIVCDGVDCLTISDVGVVTLGEDLEERKVKNVPLSMCQATDATHNTDIAIGDQTYRWTVTMTDADTSTIECEVPADPAWDEAELWIRLRGGHSGARDGVVAADISMVCIGDSETLASVTYNGETTLDISNTGYADDDNVITPITALTVAGCAEGDTVWIRYQIDATGTTETNVANLHLRWMDVYFSYNTWSN